VRESSLQFVNQQFNYGDVAFVHYYYTTVKETQDGKKKTESGRWTDILLKQGTRWVMIGDHGGSDKQE
jgi:ketosteroid isomerase-like protein